ncbi:MAG: fructosamine kinase family protein [Chloroherpetonaceae bacterium]|nr:fructosamine kinase family protein [Chloroherpetonaceae bacterium]
MMKFTEIQREIEGFLGFGEVDFLKLKEDAISLVYKVKFLSKTIEKQPIIVKVDLHDNGSLVSEANSLIYLFEFTKLPVPKVIKSSQKILAMSFIAGSTGTQNDVSAEIDLAVHLSALHNQTATYFGFDFSTPLGGISQVNSKVDRWISFFGENRLLAIAELAIRTNRISLQTLRKIEKLIVKLEELITEPEKPNLFHGDIWSGNIIVAEGKIAGFIDPAISFAHRELELALINLFNTAGKHFWKAYHERYPIEQGFWEERCEIYQLHPLLVHAALFGGHYSEAVSEQLKQIGF